MVPAIYTDADEEEGRCDFAQIGKDSSVFEVLQTVLSAVIPYLIPYIILWYPIFRLTKVIGDVEDPAAKNNAVIAIVIAITFMMTT